jgi:hypothetical protein
VQRKAGFLIFVQTSPGGETGPEQKGCSQASYSSDSPRKMNAELSLPQKASWPCKLRVAEIRPTASWVVKEREFVPCEESHSLYLLLINFFPALKAKHGSS